MLSARSDTNVFTWLLLKCSKFMFKVHRLQIQADQSLRQTRAQTSMPQLTSSIECARRRYNTRKQSALAECGEADGKLDHGISVKLALNCSSRRPRRGRLKEPNRQLEDESDGML